MRDSDAASEHVARVPGRAILALLWIAVPCVAIELTLVAADLRLVGSPLWRGAAYQNGAFWPGLLHGWESNYRLQPVVMFVTYAFLHGGPSHLAGNMITLLVLGAIAVARVGVAAFFVLYTVSALGGAALFGVLAAGPTPMVGASGALFGLAGAWLYWSHVGARPARGRRWRLAGAVGFLLLLNAALWLANDGRLAWQTHLGGFIAGGAVAAALDRRRRASVQ